MGIEIQGVVKYFDNFKALDDVTLKVSDGELLALLGPSGSGKTTLLRIIAGIEIPDAGCVLINGENVSTVSSRNRRVGFVFQHYALFKNMTVFENVAFGLRVRPKKDRPSDDEIKNKVMELLNLIQLEKMHGRYPAELSGGQRQRVALARALAIEPKVLLLDEPFGALDAKVRRDLRQWLRHLHEQIHLTSIFVTHDQEEALELADQVAVMNEGRIQQVGTPDEVYHQPANAFVYHFLGNVNLFHGRVEGGTAVLDDGSKPAENENTDGKQKIYVRPHLLDIDHVAEGTHQLQAVVKHINAAGPIVKVDLSNNGKNMIRVEITHERLKQLNLKKDDRVFVNPKAIKIFTEDYSI